MSYPRLFLVFSVVLLAGCAEEETAATDVADADLVLLNGAVYTMDASRSWASAVAIRDGRIVAVGTDEDIRTLQGPATESVDLGGRMLLPAFQDAHIHPISSGREALTVDLNGLGSIEAYVNAVAAYAAANPDEEWITGGGWSMDAFGPGARASKSLIDAVVADRPVFLVSADGHSAWANSRALELAGVDQDTPDPVSGIIDRDPVSGEIIGSFQEGAMELVAAHVPPQTAEFDEQALAYSVQLLNSYGITAINDASVSEQSLITYRSLDDRGDLSLRVTASLWWERSEGLEQLDELKRLRSEYTAGNVRPEAVKIMQDGVMENYTAAMSEPYLVDGDPTGIPMVEPRFLEDVVATLDAEGFQVHFHAIGDAAISQCLDAVAAAIDRNGRSGLRHHISHLQAIHPRDLPRFRQLDVIANFQPLWAYADPYITDLTLPFIGEERSGWMYTIRSVLNAGGMVAFGSDWSVSTANPFWQIETAVTRTDATGNDAPFMPHETVDLPTALAAFTISAAYLNGIDSDTGSIEAGKLADLIVLDRNLFDIRLKEISDTTVLLTLFAGEPVHGDFDLAGE